MLRERITSQRKNMIPGQTLVGNYILEYLREAAFLNVSQFGKQVGVNETMVLRLAHPYLAIMTWGVTFSLSRQNLRL